MSSLDPVLVVGAGPTGLTLAADLAHHGVPVRLVDKLLTPSPYSRAIAIQSGTLVALADAFGPEGPLDLVESGVKVTGAHLHIDDRPAHDVGIDIAGDYPFILMVAQTETERVLAGLASAAGVTIERGTTFVDFDEATRLARLTHADGREERLQVSYVAGCDGSHSSVRHAIACEFEGEPYAGDFILGDVRLEWPVTTEGVNTFVNDRGLLVAFPMRGGRTRLIVVQAEPAETEECSHEELTAATSRIAGFPVGIHDAHWIARFRTHHRLADRWRGGRMFLAGDAAHIHSPAGGQGMNTGIQDALLLAHLLTRVVKDGAPDARLDEYQAERLPIARGVVRGTDLFFKQALHLKSGVSHFMRRFLAPRLIGSRFFRKRIMNAMSELEPARRLIALRRS